MKQLARISANRQDILIALAKYRFLDSKHIFALIDWHTSGAARALQELSAEGLIEQLPERVFKRSPRNDPFVYQLSKTGAQYLEEQGLTPPRVTYIGGSSFGTPVHNLAVCHIVASFEIALRDRFIPWCTILAKAPEATRNRTSPHRFKLKDGDLMPDAMFSIDYPDQFIFFALEFDLTNHGTDRYAHKAHLYQDLIRQRHYQTALGMTQHMYVLTICTVDRHMRDTVIPAVNGRTDYFLYKAMPQYGSYQTAPEPALTILDGWEGKYRNLGELDGYTKAA